MVLGSIASKDKGTPSLAGLLWLPAQNQLFHSRDPERRWKWNYCSRESLWGRQRRRRRWRWWWRWRRGVKGAQAFCWWSRVWFSDNVRFVTTSPRRSSWIIYHKRSRRASLELSVTHTFLPMADGWETAERQYLLSLIFNLAVQVEGGCAVGGSFTTQLPKTNVGNICFGKSQIYCNFTFPYFHCLLLCCDNMCLWSS